MVTALRSFAYALGFYLGSIPFVLVALACAPLGQEAVIAVARHWVGYAHWAARWLAGTRLRVEGSLPVGPVIVASKHESFLETYELLRLLPRAAVVFKAELLRIPLWGRVALTHGVIPVARETGAPALRAMLAAARAAVAKGRPVIIFPEGTRVPHGEAPALRPGLAGLYKSLGLPIVPVALDSGAIWGWKRFTKRAGTVTIRIGTPIPPGLPRADVEQRVHAAINALNPTA